LVRINLYLRSITEKVYTNIYVKAGDSISTHSKGIIFFSLASWPKANADGEIVNGEYIAALEGKKPPFPAPGLNKHSLVCNIGNSKRWYQGGCKRTFTVLESGELILSPNDNRLYDNSGAWIVTIYHKPMIERRGIITVLNAINNGNNTIEKIVQNTRINKTSCKRIVSELKHQGFITQERSNKNDNMLSITKIGLHVLKEQIPKIQQKKEILEEHIRKKKFKRNGIFC
jgi:predicted transcriptional regulator